MDEKKKNQSATEEEIAEEVVEKDQTAENAVDEKESEIESLKKQV